jgi:hypothetical protein
VNIEIANVHCSIANCHLRAKPTNGDDRVRTDGLRSASAALSQLSYIPLPNPIINMGLGRVELPTSRLSGVRSNHLSYRPDGVRLGIRSEKFFGVGEPDGKSEGSTNYRCRTVGPTLKI